MENISSLILIYFFNFTHKLNIFYFIFFLSTLLTKGVLIITRLDRPKTFEIHKTRTELDSNRPINGLLPHLGRRDNVSPKRIKTLETPAPLGFLQRRNTATDQLGNICIRSYVT